MNLPDYYAILEIPHDATEAEIRRAYHARVRKYHPDLHPLLSTANEKLKQVNAAGEILCNPERRYAYDRLRLLITDHPQRSMFDSTGEHGYDVEYPIVITAFEAQHGTQRSLMFHNRCGQLETLSITIPAGVPDGAHLCCRGQGGPNRAGTHHGDLYVHVLIVATWPVPNQGTRHENALGASPANHRFLDWLTRLWDVYHK